MFGADGGYRFPLDRFERIYRCYPTCFIGRHELENGDKVILPLSALDRLASFQIDYPMLFELHNFDSERTSHCGVLEFVAEEGFVFMPHWMMRNMELREGDIVRVRSATLSKGRYVKLQPHTSDFLRISDPKAVLEATLQKFSCLTVGDTIRIVHQNREYDIDIKETKPESAVTIIETDCEVDFAPPLDYKEPSPPNIRAPPASAVRSNTNSKQLAAAAAASSRQKAIIAEDPKQPAPFTGVGRRIADKPPASGHGDVSSLAGTSSSVGGTSQCSSQTAAKSGGTSTTNPPGKSVLGESSSTTSSTTRTSGSVKVSASNHNSKPPVPPSNHNSKPPVPPRNHNSKSPVPSSHHNSKPSSKAPKDEKPAAAQVPEREQRTWFQALLGKQHS